MSSMCGLSSWQVMNVLVLLLPFALASSDCGAVLIIKNPCCSVRKTWGFGGKHPVGVAIFQGIPGWTSCA